ncbi:hypothetical protein T484DRAFT_1757606 [Baffinella frigidus]|nr:hypothetical protein T484DRAFT_1757606 [Cryptophyta sp. CCMP2293]
MATIKSDAKVSRGKPRSRKVVVMLSAMEMIAKHELKSARSAATKAINRSSRANDNVEKWVQALATAAANEAARIAKVLELANIKISSTEATAPYNNPVVVEASPLAIEASPLAIEAAPLAIEASPLAIGLGVGVYDSSSDEDSDSEDTIEGGDEPDESVNVSTTIEMDETSVEAARGACMDTVMGTVVGAQAV